MSEGFERVASSRSRASANKRRIRTRSTRQFLILPISLFLWMPCFVEERPKGREGHGGKAKENRGFSIRKRQKLTRLESHGINYIVKKLPPYLKIKNLVIHWLEFTKTLMRSQILILSEEKNVNGNELRVLNIHACRFSVHSDCVKNVADVLLHL